MHSTQSPTRVIEPSSPAAAPALLRSPSNVHRNADTALVVALVAPPVLIATLSWLGLSFGLAVCVVFAVVFVVTTVIDARWMWRRRQCRRCQRNLE